MTDNHLDPSNSPPPPKSNNVNKLFAGILLGILGTFVVGAGTCAFILNPPSFGTNSVDTDQQKRQLAGLKAIQQKANTPNADGLSLWMYSHILASQDALSLLKIPQTAEQNKALANQYLVKSATLGQPEAMLELGDSLLEQSLSNPADGSSDYTNANVTNPAQLDTAINWYIKAYQQTCDFKRLDSGDSYTFLDSFSDINNLVTGGSLNPQVQDLQHNPAITRQPKLLNKVASLVLKAQTLCYSDRESITRTLIEHIVSPNDITPAERQLDYVVAKLIDEQDIMYLQHKKVPANEVATFDSQTQALYDDYIKLFGKPNVDGVETASTAVATASVASVQ